MLEALMNRSEFVFKAIDVLGYLPQNSEKFSGITSVKDIKYSNKGNGSLTSGDLYFKTDFIGDGKKISLSTGTNELVL